MIALAPLVLSLLAQAPKPSQTVVVLPVLRPEVLSNEKSLSVCERISTSLRLAGFEVPLEPRRAVAELERLGAPVARCKGPDCVAQVGRKLEVAVVVSVEAAEIQTRLAVVAKAWGEDPSAPLAEVSFLASASGSLGDALDPFVERLRAVAPRPEPKPPLVVAVPRVDPLAPDPTKPPPVVLPDPAASAAPSPVPGYTLAGGAVLAVGAAVAFGALSAQHSARLAGLEDRTGPEALDAGGAATLNGRLAIGSAALGVVLGLASASLWSDGPAR